MSETSNPTRLGAAQRFVMHIGHRDADQAIGLLAAAVTYRVSGSGSMAATFTGSEQVAAHLCDLVERTRGTFQTIKWEDWMVGEYHVAAWADIHVQMQGRDFTGRVLFSLRFDREDKIDEIVVLPEDPHAAERFFAT